jgi:predicted Zn-dependent peptidase
VVAVTVAIPGGSSADERELAGSSWLLAQAVRDGLEEPLARLGATVSVRVDRAATYFQLQASPGAWRAAYETLVDGVFDAPVGFAALDRTRSELQALFRFEQGAPVREFQGELASLVSGPGSSWARDPRGTSESVQRITATDLNALRRRVYAPEDAVVSIVGALAAPSGVALYEGSQGDGGGLRTRNRAGGPAWSRGQRERLVRPVTNAWIGVAFPARRDASRTALDFVAKRLAEELNPTPRDPGLFGTQVRVEDLPEGPAIVIEAAVLPEDQARWEERIVRTLRVLEDRYREPTYFNLHQRHFRNASLVQESAPESEGIRIAADVLRDGRARDLAKEIDALTSQDVLRAIGTLGEPRVLVFGPQLGR